MQEHRLLHFRFRKFMEIPDPVNLPVFFAILDRHHFEWLCPLLLTRDRPPFPIPRAIAKDSSLWFYIKIVVKAADLVNAVPVQDPNVAIHSAVGMDRNIQMRADDVLYSPPGLTQRLLNFAIYVIPQPATTASQIVVKRSKDISEILIA